MKTLKKISLLILVVVFAIQITRGQAQDYKGHRIDDSGKVTDKDGKHIGNVTKEGVIRDASGMKVAYVDGNGSLIDAISGKNLGKVGKNGNFVPYSAKSANESWSVSSPENGTCLIKDKDGNIKAEVHETYKNIGACAIHCLTQHMKHGEVMDESKMESASYTCSMHPDVTSDKPGKCSKCGMDLVKKKK